VDEAVIWVQLTFQLVEEERGLLTLKGVDRVTLTLTLFCFRECCRLGASIGILVHPLQGRTKSLPHGVTRRQQLYFGLEGEYGNEFSGEAGG